MEIYDECIYDLLAEELDRKTDLKIRGNINVRIITSSMLNTLTRLHEVLTVNLTYFISSFQRTIKEILKSMT